MPSPEEKRTFSRQLHATCYPTGKRTLWKRLHRTVANGRNSPKFSPKEASSETSLRQVVAPQLGNQSTEVSSPTPPSIILPPGKKWTGEKQGAGSEEQQQTDED